MGPDEATGLSVQLDVRITPGMTERDRVFEQVAYEAHVNHDEVAEYSSAEEAVGNVNVGLDTGQ